MFSVQDFFTKKFNLGDNRFGVHGDVDLFIEILKDLYEFGKDLKPSDHWAQFGGYSDSNSSGTELKFDEVSARNYFQEKFPDLKSMLDPWIGSVGMQSISEEYLRPFQPIFESLNNFDIPKIEALLKSQLLNTDVGTILDLSILQAFSNIKKASQFSILEIGGGYGRLAEAIVGIFQGSKPYVLVDAVPTSLLYSYQYLKSRLPLARVGFYLLEEFDPSKHDVYILPPWHLDDLEGFRFDLAVNIESMQEMTPAHTQFYLSAINNLLKENAHFYFSNSFSYKNPGPWPFPENWRALIWHNTPRSWSKNHPTILFEKSNFNWTLQNEMLASLHQSQVSDWLAKLKVAEQQNEIDCKDEELGRLRKNKPKGMGRFF